MTVRIRPARASDDAALASLDRRCWSPLADVVPARTQDTTFFGSDKSPGDVIVASRNALVIGWVRLVAPTPLVSNAHVQQLQGLGVHPDMRGHGVARMLLQGALDLAWSRDARKVCLRVLATNKPAQNLYRSMGFTVEGVLADEFLLQGEYVDDLLMAIFAPS